MDALLGTMPDKVAAAQLGISRSAAKGRRYGLGIPPWQSSSPRGRWTLEVDTLLGTDTDRAVGERVGISTTSITWRRRQLGVPSFGPTGRPIKWTPELDALLGELTDREVGDELVISNQAVRNRRHELGISSWRSQQPAKESTRWQQISALPYTHTWEEWEFACEWFDNRCAYCDVTSFLTQDHLVPVSGGGPWTVLNIIPACVSCNSSKGSRQAHLWIYEKFGMEKGSQIVKRIVAYLTKVSK